jgi:hypothetical protein
MGQVHKRRRVGEQVIDPDGDDADEEDADDADEDDVGAHSDGEDVGAERAEPAAGSEAEGHDPMLIDAADLDGVESADYEQVAAAVARVTTKVSAYAATRGNVPSHVIAASAYDVVYATSDVHAAFAKLLQILRSAGLITGDDVCAKWVAQKTLLVICGDLVDGKRGAFSVDDPKGTAEWYIHCLLYNLRIQARKLGSEVRFVLGNHDLFSVIAAGLAGKYGWAQCYMHAEALSLFGTESEAGDEKFKRRSACLTPFYECSPYVVLDLEGEVIFVHGGVMERAINPGARLRWRDGGLPSAVRALQAEIDAKSGSDRIDLMIACANISEPSVGGMAMWTRAYGDQTTASVCADDSTKRMIKEGVGLVVVGHCVTQQMSALQDMWTSQCPGRTIEEATDDGAAGCMLVHVCEGLAVALVDTGMSACMSSNSAERQIEALKLTRHGVNEEPLGKTKSYEYVRVRLGPRSAFGWAKGRMLFV